MTFQLNSTAFTNGQTIPLKHTCSGADVSPALAWNDAPAATQSFTLIVEDPDAPAGNWVHWIIYNIPAQCEGLEEGIAKTERVAGTGVQGRNDFRRTGYNGPCPPPGKPHRYFFDLYAVDRLIQLNPGATKAEVEKAIHGHVLAQAQLIGIFSR